MNNSEKEKETPFFICFREIVFEDPGEEKKTKSKISRKLKKNGFSKIDEETIEKIRVLSKELKSEILKFEKSKYYIGIIKPGKTAAFEDFNGNKMVSDYLEKYEFINSEDMSTMVWFSIYAYYMR